MIKTKKNMYGMLALCFGLFFKSESAQKGPRVTARLIFHQDSEDLFDSEEMFVIQKLIAASTQGAHADIQRISDEIKRLEKEIALVCGKCTQTYEEQKRAFAAGSDVTEIVDFRAANGRNDDSLSQLQRAEIKQLIESTQASLEVNAYCLDVLAEKILQKLECLLTLEGDASIEQDHAKKEMLKKQRIISHRIGTSLVNCDVLADRVQVLVRKEFSEHIWNDQCKTIKNSIQAELISSLLLEADHIRQEQRQAFEQQKTEIAKLLESLEAVCGFCVAQKTANKLMHSISEV